uniref:Ganglioside induced differentiation associated protein 1 n=2 Tax=Canis lupus familiaris TaxID=9615 RepID=A0A8C0N9E3_CANLF
MSVQILDLLFRTAVLTSPLEWTALFLWGGMVLGPACSVSPGGVLGILKMPFWCLDTTTGPWHGRENVCSMWPSPHFARKDSKGQNMQRVTLVCLGTIYICADEFLSVPGLAYLRPDMASCTKGHLDLLKRVQGWRLGAQEKTPRLMPDKGSMYYPRVQHYRELLDSLPMDAYTHGCILHPELTVDSMIPAYATTRIRSQIGNTESELKKLAEENPDLQEAYIAKQKRLKSKLLDHDNVKYLKKILDELEKVLDQVETELQRRNEETPEEGRQPWLCGESFTLADVSLAVTLHRLKFLGFARRNWGNGKRPNLETYYERVLKRKTFNKVLGHVNNILISAVLPTAFRVAKKRAPKVLGTTLVVGLLAGMGYFAFMLFRKRLGSMILALRPRPNYF